MASIDIIFDGPPGHEGGRFIEVEDDRGYSINVGEWIEEPGGRRWALRLPDHRELEAELKAANANIQALNEDLAKYKALLKERDELLEGERAKLNHERAELAKLQLAAPVMLTVMALLSDEADIAGLRESALWFYDLDPDHLETWLDAEHARTAREKAKEQAGG